MNLRGRRAPARRVAKRVVVRLSLSQARAAVVVMGDALKRPAFSGAAESLAALRLKVRSAREAKNIVLSAIMGLRSRGLR